ncbi:MAG: type II 3-dehydroquinate dehydratase [Rickettsiales bacterium]|nr:type II 3-dehydroquinate dehydratase [Rickettsiales bacterium]
MPSVLILNGPNLNLLGTREPEIYGSTTLEDIKQSCQRKAQSLSITLGFEQSNHEGELVDFIQSVREHYDGLIINAGAFTHTSVALHDALMALDQPIIELHISNVFQREEFRHKSYISQPAKGVLCGFGPYGYEMALDAMAQWVSA